MVFVKLASVFYSFLGQRQQARTKELLRLYKVLASTVSEKIINVYWSSAAAAAASSSSSFDVLHGGGASCCVCLSRLKDGEEIRVLPCLHKFHDLCIDKWFFLCRKTCPLCRVYVGDEEEEKFQKSEEMTEEMAIWFSSFHVAGF